MIHFIQLYKLVDDKKLFLSLFNDLSYEIDELGYEGFEGELINDLLFTHFGIEIECERQLERVTMFMLNHQGELDKRIESFKLFKLIA